MKNEDLKIAITQNKYGYLGADIYVGNKRIGLTNHLTKFELTYLYNRKERLTLDVVQKEYQGKPYEVLVIRDTSTYDDEYIVIRIQRELKELLCFLVTRDKGDVF